jgi:hypothetical protein
MVIHRLFERATFGPVEITRMARAYDLACLQLHLSHHPYAAANEVVALKTIHIFQTGERDPERIADRIVEDIGQVLV